MTVFLSELKTMKRRPRVTFHTRQPVRDPSLPQRTSCGPCSYPHRNDDPVMTAANKKFILCIDLPHRPCLCFLDASPHRPKISGMIGLLLVCECALGFARSNLGRILFMPDNNGGRQSTRTRQGPNAGQTVVVHHSQTCMQEIGFAYESSHC